MSQDIQQLKDKIIPVLKDANVIHSAVFGSVARGEATSDSDVDLLVELPEGKTLLDFVELKLKLEEAVGRDVDIVEPVALHPLIKERILSEQIPLL